MVLVEDSSLLPFETSEDAELLEEQLEKDNLLVLVVGSVIVIWPDKVGSSIAPSVVLALGDRAVGSCLDL